MICKLSSKPEDQCTNPDYLDCKHCDYGFDIFLREMGIELLEYQKNLLKHYIRYDKKLCCIPVCHELRTAVKQLTLITEVISKGGSMIGRDLENPR